MNISEGGGGEVKISYDSASTVHGAEAVLKALNDYKASNKAVLAKFASVLEELEGAAIESYQSAVAEYESASRMAEEYLDLFLKLMELTDTLINAADRRSEELFNSIEV
ncbi:hypothetical protein [Peribacillus kribbensis]|uniref:hypothetical protein n=1 Tax=Peribacillus kribbensis TaxID=356658 RepID=UPI00042924A4|nr:hypothetical protein [Peribacillus kribbensis]